MGDVINLNQFRKARQRQQAEEQARRNRAKYGETKGQRSTANKAREEINKNLDGARRDDDTSA
jgi:hypothetical protein